MRTRSLLVVGTLIISMFGFVHAAYAADLLTAAPKTAATDNLIGATNAQWVFTATTTGQINEGALVKFLLPSVQQAVPFSIGTPSVVASSSIVLVTSTSTHALGVSAGQSQNGTVIYGYASSTVPAGTTFSVTLGGINNAQGQLAQMSGLKWNLQAGTTTNPMQAAGAPLMSDQFNATSTVNLIRAGGALVSDSNSKITPSSTVASATGVSYTFSITTATQISVGGKVVINFPSVYNVDHATSTASTQNISNNTAAQIAVGAVATSSDPGGTKRVIFTVSNAPVNAGDVLTVTVAGLTNPATADTYRPFSVFTTKSNNGLIDGSYFGFEQSDYGSGAPPPNDTVYIGGTNTLNVQVLKSDGAGGTTALTAGERAQVKVGAGCPDRQYFMGTQWLDSNGVAHYQKILDCNYMVSVEPFSATSTDFYNTFLPPGMKQVNLVSSGGVGQTATTTLVFGVPNSTSTVQVNLPSAVAGAKAFVQAYSADNQSFSPIYTTLTGTTQGFDGSGHGYARIRIDSGKSWNFNVMGGQFGASGNITDGSGNKYWAPQLPSLNLTAASSSASLGTFAYTLADKTLNVTLQDTNGSAITNACVGVSRSGGGIFMGPQDMICSPNNGNSYQFKVPAGTVTVDVSRPGHGAPAEFPVAISGATTNKTIALAAPTSYVNVLVQTSSGTKIKGAPVFANGGNGFGNAMTDTNGAAKIYVSPGTYSVQGFAPGFGPFTAQTATVTNGSNPSVTFTVNTGALKTVSGTVTVGGVGVAGMNIGAYGTGGTSGGNGTQTDANGSYTLYLPAGTYKVSGWSPSTGGLAEQAVDISSADASSIDWTLGAQGTLHLTIHHASGLSLFAGAFDSTTGMGNGTNSWTTTGTDKIADITLPAGTHYTVQANSPGLGQFGSQTGVTITGGGTTNITFDATASTTLATLSGSVTSGGPGVANINVWASRSDGPGFFSTLTDASGNYSLSVPDGKTYNVGVRSLNYIPDQGDATVAVSGNTTQDFTLTAAGSTISGTVQDSGGAGIAKAWVSAVQTGVATSTQIGIQADDAGHYSLNVTPGSTWSLTAQGACHPRGAAVSATAGDTKNLTLAAQSGCAVAAPTVYAITDTTGGQISTGNITINIPPNALGTSQQTDTVSVYTTASNVVSSANKTPLAGSVRDIVVTDPSGKPITSLNGMVSITTSYDPSTLPANATASDLQLSYFDNGTGQWEPVAATIDTVNHTFTVQTNHFTEYGPVLPGVPDAPTGLSASAASASSITLSWTASPSATSYTIYRSSTDSNFTTAIKTGETSTSYTDSGLSAATTYYYEVAGVNSKGEGLNSSSAHATTNAAPANSGSAQGTLPVGTAWAPNPLPGATASTVSGGVTGAVSAAPASANASAASPHAAISAQFAIALGVGMRGADVKRLQALLGVTQTGYFGPQTRTAVEAFQAKYGIASSGTPGYGLLGPKTRAKLAEVFSSSASTGVSTAAAATTTAFTRHLQKGMTGADVRTLQVFLNADPDTRIAESGVGSPGHETDLFGSLTEQAVERFQLKYGIVSSPAAIGYGLLGPKTRAKLDELLAATTTATSSASR